MKKMLRKPEVASFPALKAKCFGLAVNTTSMCPGRSWLDLFSIESRPGLGRAFQAVLSELKNAEQ